ncbi:hypothetical protein [Nocardioides sp. Leaf374]|uniref:hypothetical protein n=1 Tax=Nocardioides sp. Leaf374 TaxID=2876560 RepID=UPI001E5DE9FB|nr:hypothetical protein [Nocardioides sp. Leaf374]
MSAPTGGAPTPLGLRLALGAVGVALGLYGAWLLWSRAEPAQVLDALLWAVSGVVLHDAVLAPLVLVLVAVGVRVVPRPFRAPTTVGLVLLGSLTLLAVPVLGRFGERADNPTLLDRDYTAGWLAVAGLVLLGVVVAGLLRRRAQRAAGPVTADPSRPSDPPDRPGPTGR